MSNSKQISEQEQQKRVNSWEAIRQDLNKQFRDSGLTERATEESDGELTASIPQGKRPNSAPGTNHPLDGEDISVRPSLISNAVPRNLWPQGQISPAQAEQLIAQYGSKAPSTTENKAD